MTKATRIATAAVAIFASIALAGCGSSGTGSSSSGSSAVQPLVLYAAMGYDKAVAQAFTKKTGIPVKVNDDSTGPLLTKVAAEKNNPQWSLLWVDGDTAFASLDTQGMLLPYQSTSASFTTTGQNLQPKNHSYTAVATTIMAACIYNAAKASAVPTTYQDLLTSAYKGKVGMNDPSQSGPTFPFIAGLMNQLGGTVNGVSAGKAFLTKLKANGLHVYPTNGDTLHAVQTGQIDYGLIQSTAAIGEVIKAKPTASYNPKIVYLPKSTLMPSGIAISKGSSPTIQKEAKQFIDYVLSPEGQAVMQNGDPQGDGLYSPLINNVTKLSQVPVMPASHQIIDPYFWGPLESQINTWFDSNIK